MKGSLFRGLSFIFGVTGFRCIGIHLTQPTNPTPPGYPSASAPKTPLLPVIFRWIFGLGRDSWVLFFRKPRRMPSLARRDTHPVIFRLLLKIAMCFTERKMCAVKSCFLKMFVLKNFGTFMFLFTILSRNQKKTTTWASFTSSKWSTATWPRNHGISAQSSSHRISHSCFTAYLKGLAGWKPHWPLAIQNHILVGGFNPFEKY